MVRTVLYVASVALFASLAFLSCKEDGLSAWTGDDVVLSAYKEKMVSRAAAEYYFSAGTKYRIWIMDANTSEPAFDGQADGMEGTEKIRQDGLHYIDLGLYNDNLVGEYDFYGITDSTGTVPQQKSSGVFDVVLNQETNDYVDYRRGELKCDEQEASSVLRMPFKHIMSQVKIKVMRQDDVTSELTLKSVKFIGDNTASPKGVTSAAEYNVFYNEFISKGTDVRTFEMEGGIKVPAVSSTSSNINDAADVGTYLFFPEEKTQGVYYMRVVFDDPGNWYGKGNSDVTVDIPIYDNRVEGEYALHFEQNTSYTLCITFLSNTARIVTLVPKVYEWLDGETSHSDEDGFYEEQDLGQPVTFNGVMWSDRNLGATSAHPTRSMDDWNRSVGYFYQYGRNIPYFAYPKVNNDVDYDAPLSECLFTGGEYTGKNFIYPVVNFESWGTTLSEEKERISPVGNLNYNFIKLLGEPLEENRYWGFVFNSGFSLSNVQGQGWSDNSNTPCPPGWRLPTTDDFKGVLPGSGYSGNITFRKYTGIGSNGGWMNGSSGSEPDFEVVFSKEKISEYKTFAVGSVEANQQAYQGFFPCIYREEKDDPENGEKSQYVLSMKGNDWVKMRDLSGNIRKSNTEYVYNWGVIYGIKNVGTASAYRVKWEIRLQSESLPETDDEGVLNYKDAVRGVFVISRYQTSKDDCFEPDANGSYEHIIEDFDWEHPVEQLLLPIGGICDNWSGGKLANIGTESWYAISDRKDVSGNGQKNIFWLKYCGTETISQTAIISNKSLMSASVQVRCVRDLDN